MAAMPAMAEIGSLAPRIDGDIPSCPGRCHTIDGRRCDTMASAPRHGITNAYVKARHTRWRLSQYEEIATRRIFGAPDAVGIFGIPAAATAWP